MNPDMDLLRKLNIDSEEYFRLIAVRQEKIAVEQTNYVISLQRAIAAHCRNEVAETTGWPHCAEKLNECLARHNAKLTGAAKESTGKGAA